MDHLYEITDLSFSYSKRKVLDIKKLHVSRNRVTAVVGPNGCGKSTKAPCSTCCPFCENPIQAGYCFK